MTPRSDGTTHHRLEPEATGTVGPGATWTHDERGRRVQGEPLRCELAGWLGDDLVDVTPDLVVTSTLAEALRTSELSGFALGPAEVTRGEEFVSYAGPLPTAWERLRVTGDADVGDDLADGGDVGGVLVSPRALVLLAGHRVRQAVLTPAPGAADAAEVRGFVARQQPEGAEDPAPAADDEGARLAALADRSAPAPSESTLPSVPSMRTEEGGEVSGA